MNKKKKWSPHGPYWQLSCMINVLYCNFANFDFIQATHYICWLDWISLWFFHSFSIANNTLSGYFRSFYSITIALLLYTLSTRGPPSLTPLPTKASPRHDLHDKLTKIEGIICCRRVRGLLTLPFSPQTRFPHRTLRYKFVEVIIRPPFDRQQESVPLINKSHYPLQCWVY